MVTLPAFTTRRLVVAVVLIVLSGAFIVTATKWGIDMSFPRSKTVTTQQFAPQIGNLILSATVVAENEIMINATFSGKEYITQPGFVWTIWLSNSIVGLQTNLPEGLKLVEGTLKTNDSSPLPNNVISLHAKAQATADGEWVVYARFSATRGPGEYYALSTGGIKISVSNSSIAQVEEMTYHSNQPTQQSNNPSTEKTTNPPTSP